jgi:tetratricopeptide (TPR) repeat protein
MWKRCSFASAQIVPGAIVWAMGLIIGLLLVLLLRGRALADTAAWNAVALSAARVAMSGVANCPGVAMDAPYATRSRLGPLAALLGRCQADGADVQLLSRRALLPNMHEQDRFDLAVLELATGDIPAVIDQLRQVHHSGAYFVQRAYAALQVGDFQKAAEFLDLSGKLDEDPSVRSLVRKTRCQLAASAGRWDDATDLCRQSFELEHSAWQAIALGIAYLRTGANGEATSLLSEAVREWPNEPELRGWYARALLADAQTGPAIAEFDAALHAGMNDPWLLFEFAAALDGAGQKTVACGYLQRKIAASSEQLRMVRENYEHLCVN